MVEKRSNNNFYFIIGFVVVTIFFINLIFLYDRSNTAKIKQVIQTYEEKIKQITKEGLKLAVEKPNNEIKEPIPKEKNNMLDDLKKQNNRLNGELDLLKKKLRKKKGSKEKIPIVVMCYNRPDYLERTIKNLLEYMPADDFFLVISQDGNDAGISTLIKDKLAKRLYSKYFFHHIQHTERTLPEPRPSENLISYYYISQHYQYAISTVFERFKPEALIIIEDDMLVSPDFFSYFEAVAPLVIKDDDLVCASAWNDNGKSTFSQDPNTVIRTSFFPGLGWLLPAKTWKLLEKSWPAAFWDDWFRDQMKDRKKQCVFPEVSRTFTFGEFGSSGGQFYGKFLKNIKLNENQIDWNKKDLSYLSKSNWETALEKNVSEAEEVKDFKLEYFSDEKIKSNLKLFYNDEQHFGNIIGDDKGVMLDFKAGNPRASYEGIVQLGMKNSKFYLVPSKFKKLESIFKK